MCLILTNSAIAAPASIRGINWFGFETEFSGLMCTWKNPVPWHLDKMIELEFNYIRLPFSAEYVFANQWEKMDEFFDLSETRNISVLLDFHRLEKSQQSQRPFNDMYSFDDFCNAWRIILERYANRSNLHAIDIFNEYQLDDVAEWNSLATQIVSYIETRFPKRFSYLVGGTNWGGNLRSVNVDNTLPFQDRLVYTIHKYSFSSPEPMEENWAYTFKENATIVGEWGFISTKPDEVEFAKRFVDYLIKHNMRDTFFWTWSFNSGDTGGILKDDCETIDSIKVDVLKRLWYSQS